MSADDEEFPSKPWHRWGEARVVPEFAAFLGTSPWLALAPRGVGRRVLVLPGFVTGDPTTLPFRGAMLALGHRPHGWSLGLNVGPAEHVVVGLRNLVAELAHDQRGPIDIVGWSLGGVYARIIAANRPDHVRQVITVGSPIRFAEGQSAVGSMFQQMGRLYKFGALRGVDLDHLPVPSTAVFSKTDAVVAGGACRQTPGPFAENVEVQGSHIGLLHHPAVVWLIADRLAQLDQNWTPFRSPKWLNWAYPSIEGGIAAVPDVDGDTATA